MYRLLSWLLTLKTIGLDTLFFRSGSRTYLSLLQDLKFNLADSENGAWKVRQPQLAIKQLNYDEIIRVTVADEVNAFLCDGGACPFQDSAPDNIRDGLGWFFDDFSPDY